MGSASKRLLAATLVGVSALVAALVPGQAMAGQATAGRQSAALELAIYEGHSTSGPVIARVFLACDPDEGGHPTPVEACESLYGVNGFFEDLPPIRRSCPFIYAPVTVEAKGYWYRRDVYYSQSYVNACVAAAETDDVFLF